MRSEGYWRAAQLAFPLFLSIALYSRSLFGLPFLVAGLWKLGFPEALSHVSESLNPDCGTFLAFCNFFCAMGTFLHHCATAWFVCASNNGLMPVQYSAGYMAVTVPLVLQHWFVVTKYFNFWVYAVAELMLEVWWELEMFTNLPSATQWHQQIMFWSILVAHWFYWFDAVGSFGHRVFFPPSDTIESGVESVNSQRRTRFGDSLSRTLSKVTLYKTHTSASLRISRLSKQSIFDSTRRNSRASVDSLDTKISPKTIRPSTYRSSQDSTLAAVREE